MDGERNIEKLIASKDEYNLRNRMTKALTSLRPGSRWTLTGDTLEWQDEQAGRPTKKEIEAQITLSEMPSISAISDRQFFEQLALSGAITKDEARAAVKVGDIPPALQGFVDAIKDQDQQFKAQMLLEGATTFDRNHPMTEAIGKAQGMSPDQIDNFFREAAKL